MLYTRLRITRIRVKKRVMQYSKYFQNKFITIPNWHYWKKMLEVVCLASHFIKNHVSENGKKSTINSRMQ